MLAQNFPKDFPSWKQYVEDSLLESKHEHEELQKDVNLLKENLTVVQRNQAVVMDRLDHIEKVGWIIFGAVFGLIMNEIRKFRGEKPPKPPHRL